MLTNTSDSLSRPHTTVFASLTELALNLCCSIVMQMIDTFISPVAVQTSPVAGVDIDQLLALSLSTMQTQTHPSIPGQSLSTATTSTSMSSLLHQTPSQPHIPANTIAVQAQVNAPTSPARKLTEHPMTYLNKGVIVLVTLGSAIIQFTFV